MKRHKTIKIIDSRRSIREEKPRLRIMFITPRISGGGAEKVITSLASYMTERYEVYLVSMLPPKDNPYPVSDQVVQLRLYETCRSNASKKSPGPQAVSGLEVQSNSAKRLLYRIRKKIRNAKKKVYQKLKKEVLKCGDKAFPDFSREIEAELNYQKQGRALMQLKKYYQIDCAVSFLNPANYINGLSKSGIPTIISIRSCLDGPFAPPESQGRFGKNRIIRTCKKADKIVAVSKETGVNLQQCFHADSDKTTVIYNSCDMERIQLLSKELPKDEEILRRISDAEFVFVSNGRRVKKKGQWHLIWALQKTLEKHPGAILMILGAAGDRDTRVLLERLIREKHLENHVFLLGFHNNPFSILARGDAFVMTSFNEGFPNALVEAMAVGLPVISTDCRSGPREILAPGTPCISKVTEIIDYAEYGILLPECSGNTDIFRELEDGEKLLAEAMCKLIEDPDLRCYYAQRSVERAAQFHKNDIIKQWECLIQDMTNNEYLF